jgi:predicted enzyme related to lactoylglutathione lyase
MKHAVGLGGRIVAGPKAFGGQGRYCVIEDPAGAVAALFQRADR